MEPKDIEKFKKLIVQSQKLDDEGYVDESIAILEQIKQSLIFDKMVKTSKTPFFSETFWNNALKETLGQLPKKNILYQWADNTSGIKILEDISQTSDINKIKQLTSGLGLITDAQASQLAMAKTPIEVLNTFKRMKYSPEQLGMSDVELSPLSKLTAGGAVGAVGKSIWDTTHKNQRELDQRGYPINPQPFSEEINLRSD